MQSIFFPRHFRLDSFQTLPRNIRNVDSDTVIHPSIEHWPLPQRYVLYLYRDSVAMLSTTIFLKQVFLHSLSTRKTLLFDGW